MSSSPLRLAIVIGLVVAPGCAWWQARHHSAAAPYPIMENPLLAPPLEREFVWRQVVDAIDSHFKIQKEERIRVVGGVLSEGKIETFPAIGATHLEPWRDDSTPGFERLHATLQSVRRRASVRVTPAPDGYRIFVAVLKEIEDVDRPENTSVGASALRHDGTVVRTSPRNASAPLTLGWISLGRDTTLEQLLLADIQARLQQGPPQIVDQLAP
ncbi:MAG: hypothetical protein QGG36_10740 [Pirellulaceae bacterium]|nr:hypothetical protein [Pirellulaceae bacterium]MDP7016269.1 hypothetical protein [Pirellulaceae bacterium]